MRLITHNAPAASCLSASGAVRSIAHAVACGECIPDATLRARAASVRSDGSVGRVHALGTWREPYVHARLGSALGTTLAPALRADFEWYQCRGAFFHNDAHYDARLFGVWCMVGPAADLVFPRAPLRLAVGPGSIVVFDPFEVHGVLLPQFAAYSAEDYEDTEASVFVGFELDLEPAIAGIFGIRPGAKGRVISGRTRIDATSGALQSD